MAKNNVQLTSSELRQQMELLKVQLAEASKRELQPKKDEVTKKLGDLVALVNEVRELDVSPPNLPLRRVQAHKKPPHSRRGGFGRFFNNLTINQVIEAFTLRTGHQH